MNKYERKAMWDEIYVKYSRKINIHGGAPKGRFYSYIMTKEVVFPSDAWKNPDEWDIFALLHEIGHVLTNTINMKRCEQEYLATEWAIMEANNIGFVVSKSTIRRYQDYIWEWRETGIKLKAKNIPSKKELTLSFVY